MHHAAMHGSAPAVHGLLMAKAAAEGRTPMMESPLMLAAAYRHEECVKLLLTHRARVDAVDRTGRTALTCAKVPGECGRCCPEP